MKLVCDQCGARYQVADERVRGKVVTIRCRSCSAVLEAHLPAEDGPSRRRRRPSRPPPPPKRPQEWYLTLGEGVAGPMSLAELQLRVGRGETSPDDMVWTESLGGWQSIALVAELRTALEQPRPVQRSMPPRPPPRGTPEPRPARAGPSLAVIQGGLALARSQPAVQPGEEPRPTPAPAPQRALARWPVLTLVGGGLLLVGAALTFLLMRDRGKPPVELLQPFDAPPFCIEVAPDHSPASQPVLGPSVIEVPRPKAVPAGPQADGGAPDAGDRDLSAKLAARIVQRNRSTLRACVQLAERRGEIVKGSRVFFSVQMDATGQAAVAVRGEEISPALLSCYRSVAKQWKLPVTGQPYTTTFWHVH